MSQIGSSADVEIRAFASPQLPYFSRLSLHDQAAAIQRLSQSVSVVREVLASGDSVLSSATLIWRALKELGLRPASGLFETMSEGDVVEIYDLKNIQIFRNLQFFRYCSYTLEDLYSRPWTELFVRREEGVTDTLLEVLSDMLSRSVRHTIVPAIGYQTTQEVNSTHEFSIKLKIKSLALLFNSKDEPAAFLAVEEAVHLNSSLEFADRDDPKDRLD